VIGLETGQRTWRILIAEDREANRKLLVKLLQPFVTNKERPGFEIREAVNGMQAVQIWEEWEPDLIFMDMRMPEMNGHQATQKIRASTRGQATKIIALTASAFEEERQVILSEGIDDFIRKPFKEYEIFNALSKHLEDVHFIYAEVQFPAAGLLMPEALPATLENVQDRNLPAAWVARLKYAAAAADGEQILELLQEIAPDQPAQASTIENLVRQYRFDLILKYF
jgi:CheY-like chemotaxis protein